MYTFSCGRRVILLAGLASLGLTACDKIKSPLVPPVAEQYNSVDITGADYAHKLGLLDYDGRKRQLADFKGKVVFVFFGFTQCPDVCPTTVAELAQVKKKLGVDGDRLQGVFVTIDPERDSAAVLKAYLQGMDPSFVGLRGTLAETEATAREFKVFYQKVPTKNGGYTMDHTAGAFVFDPDGQIRLFVRYGMGVDALTADIKRLLAPAKT
ncbi:MAG: SCO family protein [Aquabacterium sp.]|nr:SCO family protein [Aquabacterium sp.]